MKSLTKKIQTTKLFSDAQKVALFAALDDASDADKQKLEEGIDAFDAAYAKAVSKHSATIRSVLGHIVKDMSEEEKSSNTEAIDAVKLGLAYLAS